MRKSTTRARWALATAVAMSEALARLAPALQARGVDLQIGIGVNTGDMVVGNMGSRERFDGPSAVRGKTQRFRPSSLLVSCRKWW